MSNFVYDRSCRLCRPIYRYCVRRARKEWNPFVEIDVCCDCKPLYHGYMEASGLNPENINTAILCLGDTCEICDQMSYLYERFKARVKARAPFCLSCKDWLDNDRRRRNRY